MTPDREDEARADGSFCPDAEALSCLIDGELPGNRATAVSAHVLQCAECTTAVHQLQLLTARFDAEPAVAAGVGCPNPETLAGYLIGGLSVDERSAVDAHVLTCDACPRALARAHRRLGRSWTLDAPIPPALIERALAVATPSAESRMPRSRRTTSPGAVPAFLRLPVLMPTAFAAGVAVFIAVNGVSIVPPAPVAQSRAPSMVTGSRRVTLAEALMRSAPRDGAAVVTRVPQGMAVDVQTQEREWLLVSLPTGEQGWVPRRAFE